MVVLRLSSFFPSCSDWGGNRGSRGPLLQALVALVGLFLFVVFPATPPSFSLPAYSYGGESKNLYTVDENVTDMIPMSLAFHYPLPFFYHTYCNGRGAVLLSFARI